MTRYALVYIDGNAEEVLSAYLPSNYRLQKFVTDCGRHAALISGEDRAGWTLDGYVLPRLASGLYAAREVEADYAVI